MALVYLREALFVERVHHHHLTVDDGRPHGTAAIPNQIDKRIKNQSNEKFRKGAEDGEGEGVVKKKNKNSNLRLLDLGLGVMGDRLPVTLMLLLLLLLLLLLAEEDGEGWEGGAPEEVAEAEEEEAVSSSMDGLLSLEEKWRERMRISSAVGTVGKWFNRS